MFMVLILLNIDCHKKKTVEELIILYTFQLQWYWFWFFWIIVLITSGWKTTGFHREQHFWIRCGMKSEEITYALLPHILFMIWVLVQKQEPKSLYILSFWSLFCDIENFSWIAHLVPPLFMYMSLKVCNRFHGCMFVRHYGNWNNLFKWDKAADYDLGVNPLPLGQGSTM